jgi:hypothetical protein
MLTVHDEKVPDPVTEENVTFMLPVPELYEFTVPIM